MTVQFDYPDVVMAGERLLAALAAEESLSQQRTTDASDPMVLDQWIRMRRNVEALTDEYFTANDDVQEQLRMSRSSHRRRFEFPKFIRAATR